MNLSKKLQYILFELKDHAPFTIVGSLLGIGFMLLFKNKLQGDNSRVLFDIFHPTHVFLSAIATAAMFKLHSTKPNFFVVLIIGYFGAIGIATLSDSIIPYAGERLMGIHVTAHAPSNGHAQSETTVSDDATNDQNDDHLRQPGAHLGFIENWYIVNPAAIIGVLIAYFWPRTRLPHTGHVLLSIWTSLFHVLMSMGSDISFVQWFGIALFLFVAVWLPCCISDIVFPLLFVKPGQVPPQHNH